MSAAWNKMLTLQLDILLAGYVTETPIPPRPDALRRGAEPEAFVLGGLTIHYEQRRVAVEGRPVELTATEYELLRVLSINAGRVLTHEALLRQAWKQRDRGSPGPKIVRSVVKRLRRKLGENTASPTYIHSERGVGYRMPEPADL